MKKILFVMIVLISQTLYGQSQTDLFPDNLTIQPFVANILEPRLGTLIMLTKSELRLDIGNSLDIVRIIPKEGEFFSFGVDLFTYSSLRREKDFHFPVDAIDYLFGINFGYKNSTGKNEFGARFRFSHISAHLVDGSYSKTDGSWNDGLESQVYSREFFELMPYYKINNLRLYVGLTYNYHIDPSDLGKDGYQVGFDYFIPGIIGENFALFAGYDLRIVHLEEYEPNHSLEVGIKFGKYYGKGMSLYFNYYKGKSVHGEYYFIDQEYSGIGLNFDL